MTHSYIEQITAEAAGVQITACTHGAHLLSWTSDGVERLWMSPISRCGEATSIRGGVPVLFPQFAAFGRLPKHGFARTSLWHHVGAPEEAGRAMLAFQLRDSAHSRAIWPNPFTARLTISASATDLAMTMSITNQDDYAARFTAGLHTYYAVADPEARITGLGGCLAWDGVSPEHPRFSVPVADEFRAIDERDLAVHDAIGPVVLHDSLLGDITLTADGFPDRVVWNPGPQHRLPDVRPGDEAGFVCIEPAVLTPVDLPAGQTWSGSQRLSLSS
ncbi:MAG: hypothetical protein WCF04_11155 [Candidatus Nanopelagicales bacterium]